MLASTNSSIIRLLLHREQKLPTVPETLLKRRKKVEEIRKARAFARQATAKVSSHASVSIIGFVEWRVVYGATQLV